MSGIDPNALLPARTFRNPSGIFVDRNCRGEARGGGHFCRKEQERALDGRKNCQGKRSTPYVPNIVEKFGTKF